MQQETCSAAPEQRWRVVPVDGAANLVNVASGKCLDVINASADDGGKVHQWSCMNVPNQKWRPQPPGGDPPGSVLLVAIHSNKCLDIPSEQSGPGVQLQQWSCHGGLNQRWVLAT